MLSQHGLRRSSLGRAAGSTGCRTESSCLGEGLAGVQNLKSGDGKGKSSNQRLPLDDLLVLFSNVAAEGPIGLFGTAQLGWGWN